MNQRKIKFRLRIDNEIVGYEMFIRVPGEVFGSWKYNKSNGDIWTDEYIVHNEKDQFTGLPDKNGKEIYEGDIVKAEDPKFESGIYNWKTEFFDGGFNVVNITGKEMVFSLWELGFDKEVIGNIYENPELGS